MLGTEIKVFNQEDWNGLVPAPFPTGLVTCPVTSLFGFTIVLILTFTDGQWRSENLLKLVQNVVSQHFFFGQSAPSFQQILKRVPTSWAGRLYRGDSAVSHGL